MAPVIGWSLSLSLGSQNPISSWPLYPHGVLMFMFLFFFSFLLSVFSETPISRKPVVLFPFPLAVNTNDGLFFLQRHWQMHPLTWAPASCTSGTGTELSTVATDTVQSINKCSVATSCQGAEKTAERGAGYLSFHVCDPGVKNRLTNRPLDHYVINAMGKVIPSGMEQMG